MDVSAGLSFSVGAPQFTRPNDTTAYASGDTVANNTAAGSVTVLQFQAGKDQGRGGIITRCRVKKSGTGTTGAAFRLHLFAAAPTPASGDNAAFSSSGAADYLGYLDVEAMQAFTDGAAGHGAPGVAQAIQFRPAAGSMVLYGLLEARGAYTPAAQETFDVSLEVMKD
jgi:hypothetical protein